MGRWLRCTLVLLSLLTITSSVDAVIFGDKGSSPIDDPGWPKGAAKVFNVDARVAYWVGPPFGGGRYTSECRGDTGAFKNALADFAKIDSPKKQLFVHDGIGASFWLNKNNEEEKRKAAEIDWSFEVWIPKSFQRLQKMPAKFRSESSPHPTMHVYAGGKVNWSDVNVPDGVDVVDKRLAAHGFKESDGTVLDGQVTDLESNQPMAATARLQRITPLKTGGFDYEEVKIAPAVDGKWAMKSVPEGRFRVVLSAPGYASRIVHHVTVIPEPHWIPVKSGLLKTAKVEGAVTGPDGKPLEGATVRLDDFVTKSDVRYATDITEFVTGADGKFVFSDQPKGAARVGVGKDGYCHPGLGLKITAPAKDLKLEMMLSSSIEVQVKFGAERPKGYMVDLEPEGGHVVGSWVGSASIDENNKHVFENVPPGKYILKGRPNPGSEKQEIRSPIELKGGEKEVVVLDAKS